MRFAQKLALGIAIALSVFCASSLPVGLFLHTAPAPLPKRYKQQKYLLPVCCAMHWSTVRFDARFAPDGGYEAKLGDRITWIGTWWREGDFLCIKESTDGINWVEYRIEMRPGWRNGAIGGGEFINFRIEE